MSFPQPPLAPEDIEPGQALRLNEAGDGWEAFTPGEGGGGSLGLWLYGNGSDGPLLFTATPRTVTDALLTPGSDVITSDTADFTDDDVGLVLNDQGEGGRFTLIVGTQIRSVTNATTAVMSVPALGTADGQPDDAVLIGSPELAPGQFSSITIPTGVTVRPAKNQYGVIACSGEYFIDGAVDLTGDTFASLGDGGLVAGTTGAGANGQTEWRPFGGNGGAGSTSDPGDTPGGIGASAGRNAGNIAAQPGMLLYNVNGIVPPGGVNSGAAGGGDGVNNGGDGNSNGAVVIICARSIVHGPNASYALVGQAGGAGGTGGGTGGDPVGDCGGGGGGADGWWITMSDSLSGTPAITGGGGPGGAGSGTGTDGTAGQPGFGVHYTPDGVTIQTP